MSVLHQLSAEAHLASAVAVPTPCTESSVTASTMRKQKAASGTNKKDIHKQFNEQNEKDNFTLLALVGTMSLNAQIVKPRMEIMKNGVVVATYTADQADEVVFKEVTIPTTGTAKATIGSSEVDVNWVQFWDGGPKFAEYNVGASSVTELGTKMTFTDATKAGAEYVWGANWCTPSKDDMEHLMTAAKGLDEKVKCEYTQEGSTYGFKFTGLTDGYTGNSVFFPAQDSKLGDADYWSATANVSKAWLMHLHYLGSWGSNWFSDNQGYDYLVRPVFKN